MIIPQGSIHYYPDQVRTRDLLFNELPRLREFDCFQNAEFLGHLNTNETGQQTVILETKGAHSIG